MTKLTTKEVYVPVKATDELPEKPGMANSVIIYNDAPKDRFVTSGFKNFDEEEPSLYFVCGNKSFLTVEGPGNGNSTFPVKNIHWLKPQQLYTFSKEELERLLETVYRKGAWEEQDGKHALHGQDKVMSEQIQSLF